MPQKNSKPPIGRMTWGRAVPVLVICVIFDAVRMFFEMFWFFGPALAGAICTVKVSGAIGTTAGGLVCGAGAAAVGYFGSPALITFGIIMAMTIGLVGWATVTLILAVTNPKIWASNIWGWAWSLFALGISEAPLLGTIPMLTITHWRLYIGQIRKDGAALKQYQKEQAQAAAVARSIQQQRLVEQMQAQATEPAPVDVY